MKAPIKTQLKDGQRYVDDPVFKTISKPKPELETPLALAVASMFNNKPPQEIRDFVGYERTRLRWMKPDWRGGLVPR